MTFANPRSAEVRSKILELYEKGLYPQAIAKEVNLKNHQPVYNLLNKLGLFEKKPTRYYRKYEFNQRFLRVIDSEEKAYVLGFIVADGSVDAKGTRCTIALHRKDRDVLEKIAKAFGEELIVTDMIHGGFPHSKLALNSIALVKDLANLNVFNNKSLTINGDVFKHVPDTLKRHFLRGYFDGDGHVTLGAVYSSGIKYVIDIIGTKEFLEETYVKHCQSGCKLAKYKTCDMWHWRASSKKDVLSFLHYIYDDCKILMDRKFNYFQDWLKTECAHVKSGELLET